MFFDENGIINIDEQVARQPSYQKIMADGIVTDEELDEQVQRVVTLLHRIESTCTEQQLQDIRDLLVETNVLDAIYQVHQIQENFN